MTKHMDVEALVAQAVPVAKVMSRSDKLHRWAELLRRSGEPRLILMHDLEHMNHDQLSRCHGGMMSAFGIAAADPVFKDAGLKGDTPADAMKFFEISQHELHEFSCDCGGAIHTDDMANRIDR